MIEPGEVNGVRFFQGTVINAKAEDAEKLISSGKAIFIDDEGNPVEKQSRTTVKVAMILLTPKLIPLITAFRRMIKMLMTPVLWTLVGKWITVMTVILLTQVLAPLMRRQS